MGPFWKLEPKIVEMHFWRWSEGFFIFRQSKALQFTINQFVSFCFQISARFWNIHFPLSWFWQAEQKRLLFSKRSFRREMREPSRCCEKEFSNFYTYLFSVKAYSSNIVKEKVSHAHTWIRDENVYWTYHSQNIKFFLD